METASVLLINFLEPESVNTRKASVGIMEGASSSRQRARHGPPSLSHASRARRTQPAWRGGWKGARRLGLHPGPPRSVCLGKTLKTSKSLSSPICYVRIRTTSLQDLACVPRRSHLLPSPPSLLPFWLPSSPCACVCLYMCMCAYMYAHMYA